MRGAGGGGEEGRRGRAGGVVGQRSVMEWVGAGWELRWEMGTGMGDWNWDGNWGAVWVGGRGLGSLWLSIVDTSFGFGV